MGRRLKEEVQYDAAVMEGALAVRQEEELTMQKADELYLDGQEYDEVQLVEETTSLLDLAKKSIIEAGKRLILLKVHGGHGSFGFVCQRIGIDVRTAQRYMKLARIFGKYDKLSHLPASKMNALELLSDEQLDKIENGDEVSGITLEGIQAMSTQGLRDEVERVQTELEKEKAEREKERDALESIIRKKEGKISELEMEVAGKQPPTKEELAEQSLKEIRKQMVIRFSSMNAELDELNRLLARAQETEGVTVDQLDSLADGVGEFYSLFDDKYQDFNQDMENIRPMKKE